MEQEVIHSTKILKLIKHALSNRVDRFLLMPPAYYKYDDDGVYSYYANIIQKVPDAKILLYNFKN